MMFRGLQSVIKILIAVAFSLVLMTEPAAFAAAAGPAHGGNGTATGQTRTVKVAIEDSGLFVTLDGNGKPVSGYAYEYIETFAGLAGWNVEYVLCESFSDSVQKLLDGEVDIFYDVTRTPEREGIVLFPDSPMGSEDYYLYYCSGEKRKIYPGDYASMDGARIGVTSGTVEVEFLREWCERKGVRVSIVEFDAVPEKEAALLSGEIDLDLEISMLANDGFYSVEKIASSDYYLVANRNRPDLIEDLNGAVGRMNGIDRFFLTRLEEKYFAQSSITRTLFADEAAWISARDTLTVGYLNSYMPFSGTDKSGSPTGVVTEIVPMIFSNIGLDGAFRIEYIGFDDSNGMYASLSEGRTDMVFPAYGSMDFAKSRNMSLSAEIIGAPLSLVYRGAYTGSTTAVIAVNSKNELQDYFTKTFYPGSEIRYYDTIDGCLKAVASGEAGSTVLNGFRTGSLLYKREYADLNVQTLAQSAGFSFAVGRDNGVLLSLVSRAVASTDKNTAFALTGKYLQGEYSAAEFFGMHPEYVYGAAAALTVIALAFVLFRRSQDRRHAERTRKEQIARMAGGVSAYIVNPHTEKFQIISQNRHLAENYTDDEDFTTSFSRYVATDVYGPDREQAMETLSVAAMARALETQDEYTVRYRDASSGCPRWYEMRAVRLSDDEILYGFTDRQDEITGELLYGRMKDNYFGLYYINLDTGLARIIKTGHPEVTGDAGETVSYSVLMKSIASATDGETAEFFNRISDIGYLKKRFAAEDLAYNVYRSNIFESSMWVNYTGFVVSRSEDGAPSAFALGFSLLDEESSGKEEARLKLAESMEVLDGLSDEYVAIYLLDLSTGTYRNYHASDMIADTRGNFGRFRRLEDLFNNFVESGAVHPDYRQQLHEFYPADAAMREMLRDRKEVSTLFLRNYGGEYLWTKIRAVKCEKAEEEPQHIIFGVSEIDREVRERAERFREEQEAERLIESVASRYDLAYSVSMTDDSFRILRLDESILLQEKNFEKFSEIRDFFISEIIHPYDREKMLEELDYAAIRRRLSESETYSVEYRTLIGGITNWNEMSVSRIAEDDVAIGFAIRDLEITKRLLEERRDGEYFALFSVDLDSEMLKIVKNDEHYQAVPVGESVPYSPYIRGIAEKLGGEPRAFYMRISDIEYVKRDFATDDKRTYSYRSSHIGNGLTWIDVTSYVILRHRDGTPAMLTMGFSVADALAAAGRELQEKIARQNVLLESQQEQLEEARKAAEAANRSKTSFLFNMSHDIRTPMNAITGFTSMAKKYIGDEVKVADYLDKIDMSGRQLLTLVNQVLEMARIESGRIELEENHVNVLDEYNAAVTVLAEQAKVNGLEFRHSLIDVTHFNILADTARMNSITLNITGNAMKYTPRGGSVDFCLREVPPRKEGRATFVFTVEDTGIGMSGEYLARLYDPFTREKNSTVSRIQGTGLGMSIVKQLVDLMDGCIDVRSEPGRGTRFDITIDFKIDEKADAGREEADGAAVVNLQGRRVLLVEDNELNREIALEILEEEGLAAEEADDGTRAVELLREKGPDYYDFILMDIQMPVMNGYEATRLIREMYPDRHIPVIALSANAFAEDRAASLAAGMDAHVAKPIDVRELTGALARFARG